KSKKGERETRPPEKDYVNRSELPLGEQAGVERPLERGRDAGVAVTNRSLEVGVGNVQRRILELIDAELRLLIDHVEQVGSKVQSRALAHFVAVVGVNVAVTSGWSAAKSTTTTERDFAAVLVNRVSSKVIDGNTALDAHASTQGEVFGKAAREGIADE